MSLKKWRNWCWIENDYYWQYLPENYFKNISTIYSVPYYLILPKYIMLTHYFWKLQPYCLIWPSKYEIFIFPQKFTTICKNKCGKNIPLFYCLVCRVCILCTCISTCYWHDFLTNQYSGHIVGLFLLLYTMRLTLFWSCIGIFLWFSSFFGISIVRYFRNAFLESSILSKKWTKTCRILLKTNSFICFSEEFTAWQFAFKIKWPLI